MILNGLGYASQTLYLQSDFFSDKPTERLLGEGIQAEHINDLVLGRSLDKFYEHGVSELYSGLSEQVINRLGIQVKGYHLDSSSFHADGAYDIETDEHCIQIVPGYSRDHRPELNQAVLNLITENQAGIPLYMKPASGNTSDKSGFEQIVKAHLSSLKSAHENPYFVMDSAGYTQANLSFFHEQKRYLVSRVPAQIKAAKQLISTVRLSQMTSLSNGYQGYWYDSDYGEVAQKWLLVFSQQAFEREQKTLDKQILKQAEQTRKSFKKLKAQAFSCEADAKKALQLWEKKQTYHQVSDVTISSVGRFHKAGKPPKDKPYDFYDYFIEGNLYTSINHRQKALQSKGRFIIATNDISDSLTMQELLTIYKSQQKVERGFRFLKSPEFLTSSFYLKKPERIEALLMVMTCYLLIYSGLEYKIRQQLKEKDLQFVDQKKKPTQNPTTRWVFFTFTGIHLLNIESQHSLVLNLKDKHQIIIEALGSPYRDYYS